MQQGTGRHALEARTDTSRAGNQRRRRVPRAGARRSSARRRHQRGGHDAPCGCLERARPRCRWRPCRAVQPERHRHDDAHDQRGRHVAFTLGTWHPLLELVAAGAADDRRRERTVDRCRHDGLDDLLGHRPEHPGRRPHDLDRRQQHRLHPQLRPLPARRPREVVRRRGAASAAANSHRGLRRDDHSGLLLSQPADVLGRQHRGRQPRADHDRRSRHRAGHDTGRQLHVGSRRAPAPRASA